MTAPTFTEALSTAAFVKILADMPHDFHGSVVATEHGEPWARVKLAPCGDFLRTVFPEWLTGGTGDDRRRGHQGARFMESDARHSLSVVVERARRMARA